MSISTYTLPASGANAILNVMVFPPIFAPAGHLAKKKKKKGAF